MVGDREVASEAEDADVVFVVAVDEEAVCAEADTLDCLVLVGSSVMATPLSVMFLASDLVSVDLEAPGGSGTEVRAALVAAIASCMACCRIRSCAARCSGRVTIFISIFSAMYGISIL